ncbi:ASCH domain-containing protein [Candidatus Pacearchaeota archaeon]|nr:ASCH domain-containing protein [Candidatus Pacearchaeota archaeon]
MTDGGKNILYLTLMRRWFDEILDGTKKFEYREIKPYWTKRLFNEDGSSKNYDVIYFRNGYSKGCRKMEVEFEGVRFGEFNGERVYAIGLGKVLWAGDEF